MKRILLFLLLFISAITFSETLESVSYSNGKVIGTFKENKQVMPSATVSKVGTEDVLMLSFFDTQIGNKVPTVIEKSDQYISKIYTAENNGLVVVYVYLKPSVNYQVVSGNRGFQVALSGGTAQATPSSRYTTPQRSNTNSSSSRYTTPQRPTTTTPSSQYTTPQRQSNYGQSAQTQPQQPSNYAIGNKKYTIVVDPGHGAHDSGGTGNGYKEKDIALQVGLKLAQELRKDYNVIMTRQTDVFIPLPDRPKMGNDANADLFVSIHLNAASSSSANGTEVFYYEKKETSDYAASVAKIENGVDSSYGDTSFSDYILKDIFYRRNQKESASLANDVLDNLVNNFSVRRRGVFGANFAVLRGSNSPAILIELGFMTNYGDVSQFVDSFGQERAAKSIADAIRRHLR